VGFSRRHSQILLRDAEQKDEKQQTKVTGTKLLIKYRKKILYTKDGQTLGQGSREAVCHLHPRSYSACLDMALGNRI